MEDQEYELMEIDDAVESSSSFASKRNSLGIEKSYEINPVLASASVPSKSNVDRKRRIRAKRFFKTIAICVLDTNTLLSDLNFVKSIIINRQKKFESSTKLPFSKNLTIEIDQIVVPWIVIQELDGLKNSKCFKEATNAICFINEQLKQNGLVKGERENISDGSFIKLTAESNNDDKILNCCLSLKCKYNKSDRSNSKDDRSNFKVILITNDSNLQNKSFIYDIEALNAEDFAKKYLKQSISENFKRFETDIPKSVKLNDGGGGDNNCTDETHKPRKKLKVKTPNEQKNLSSKTILNEIRRNLFSKHKESAQTNISLNKNSSCQTSNDLPITKEGTSESELDLTVKYKLEKCLIDFIVKQFTEQFGQTLWQKMIPNYDPRKCTLHESLAVLNAHWIGVFSDHFKRNKEVLNLVKDIQTQHRAKNSDQKKLIQMYEKLLNYLQV